MPLSDEQKNVFYLSEIQKGFLHKNEGVVEEE